VSKHIARMKPECHKLLGKSAFDEAKINEWIAWAQCEWLPAIHPPLFAIYGLKPISSANYAESIKEMKTLAKVLDVSLKGKQWLVGDTISLADLYVGACCAASFQTVLDAGFRKAMPNLSSWFERWATHHPVVKRHGFIKACSKALKPEFVE
jgi:elongation factor 1-gamma